MNEEQQHYWILSIFLFFIKTFHFVNLSSWHPQCYMNYCKEESFVMVLRFVLDSKTYFILWYEDNFCVIIFIFCYNCCSKEWEPPEERSSCKIIFTSFHVLSFAFTIPQYNLQIIIFWFSGSLDVPFWHVYFWHVIISFSWESEIKKCVKSRY